MTDIAGPLLSPDASLVSILSSARDERPPPAVLAGMSVLGTGTLVGGTVLGMRGKISPGVSTALLGIGALAVVAASSMALWSGDRSEVAPGPDVGTTPSMTASDSADAAPATSERRDGPTPAGGTYSMAYYFNDAGEPVAKDEATRMRITEHAADGTQLAETVGTVG